MAGLGSTQGAPTWDQYTEATCRAFAEGYTLGHSRGWHERGEDNALHARQVEVARSAEDHRAVHAARQRSAARRAA